MTEAKKDKMQWTNEKPAVPGWYWVRHQYGHDIEPRTEKVREYGGKMCILNWEVPDNALWSGPIKEPDDNNFLS